MCDDKSIVVDPKPATSIHHFISGGERHGATNLHEHANTPELFGLLCECTHRPNGCRATKNCDELAPSHCRS